MSTDAATSAVTVLVGGVGELYQGDLDVGRRVVERLAGERLGPHVVVEDLHYGAVAVAQRIDELGVTTLVLVGAVDRGRAPGTIERRRVRPEHLQLTPEELQAAIGDAVTGYVTIDLVVEVALALGSLPRRIVAIEVEPAQKGPDPELSPLVQGTLDELLDLVQAEVRRTPLLELGDRLRSMLDDDRLEPSPAVRALGAVLDELEHLDAEGRWGATFAARDRLRLALGAGETPAGMDHLDWGLWWALIEELDRVQPLESSR